jgi:hypothetical protein
MSGGHGEVVVVPQFPGPLIWPDRRRQADDLDDLIDELLPDTAEGPGPTDAALVAGGGALVGWAALGSPPVAVAVVGVAAIGLGCILPVRAGWRALTGRRRAAVLGRGVPLLVDDPTVARLVAAYEALDDVPATSDSARAAAHGAMLEVASLLDGRAPESERERNYVDVRAAAVQELVRALQELEPADGYDGTPVPRDLVVEAREELDALGGVNALSRLSDITEEVRARGRGR